jgi:Fur family transcriptional regulator, ferric uptake regulator
MARPSVSPPRPPSSRPSGKEKDLAARVAAVSARLKEQGLKRSAVRDVVLEEFLREGTHVSIEQLLERVRARVPATGYSTVYRTLRLLVEQGHAVARDFGGARTLFEPADKRHHDHIVCVRCGTVREFEDREIEALQEKAARRLGFRFTSHRLELFGLCPSCAAPEAGARPR